MTLGFRVHVYNDRQELFYWHAGLDGGIPIDSLVIQGALVLHGDWSLGGPMPYYTGRLGDLIDHFRAYFGEDPTRPSSHRREISVPVPAFEWGKTISLSELEDLLSALDPDTVLTLLLYDRD